MKAPIKGQQYYPWFGFNWDNRSKIAPSFFANFGSWDEGKSSYSGYSVGVDIRPTSAMQVSFNVNTTTVEDNTQYYGKFTDVGGTHYSFAKLKQDTYSLSTRLSYTMTPTLSLQLYAQPFVTKGDYSDVRELSATPRADTYNARYQAFTAPAGSQTGFNFKQLRSNTVVRWEYRPGSTLFAVWTHGREGSLPASGSKSWNDEYGDLFALHPNNTFLIKLAYWLSR